VPQARQRAAKGAAPALTLPPSTRVGGTGPIYLIRSPRSLALGRRCATPVPFPGVIQIDCALCEVLDADWLV